MAAFENILISGLDKSRYRRSPETMAAIVGTPTLRPNSQIGTPIAAENKDIFFNPSRKIF